MSVSQLQTLPPDPAANPQASQPNLGLTLPVDGGPAWLRSTPWQLRHVLGHVLAENLIFLGDGLIWAKTNVLWRWHYENNRLLIATLGGEFIMEFFRKTAAGQAAAGEAAAGPQSIGNALVLAGRLFPATTEAVELVLMPAAELPPINTALRDLNASVVLGSGSETLLVIINSGNRPFEGREYGPQWRWEFYELPEKIGVDHVRIAEARFPLNWYSNKTKRLLAMLAGIIGNGYKQVVFCGMSSGGYASLWLCETLSARFPHVMFRTATINPQTGHAQKHREAIEAMTAYRPAVMTEAAYEMRDCEETEIDALATRRANAGGAPHNIAHTIYYDAANPAEAYYVDLIKDLPGFNIRPHHFGIGHMSGCIAMYERRLVHEEVEQLCRDLATGRSAP